VTASPRDGRGTADEGPRGQQLRKRRPPQPAQLGYSTRTPDGMGNRTGPRRPPTPGIYTMGRAQRPAKLPPAEPPAARGHKPPHPYRCRSDACAAGAARWVSRGCPSTPLGAHRPLWAARDRSGRGLPRPASREGVGGLPDPLCWRRTGRHAHTPLRASLCSTLIGCHKRRSWWRISRSAPTRRDGSNLITGVCSVSP